MNRNKLRCALNPYHLFGLIVAGLLLVCGPSHAGDSEGLGGYKYKIYEEDEGATKFVPPGGSLVGAASGVSGEINGIPEVSRAEIHFTSVLIRLAIMQAFRL